MRGLWCLLALVVGLAACGNSDNGTGAGQVALQEWVGKSFAGIEVKDLDGAVWTMPQANEFEKIPVVVNVWATWCTPCLKEMPTLDALGREGKVKVVAIATDKDAAAVKEFLKNQSWGRGVTVVHDRLGAVTRKEMGAFGLPVTFVLNPSLTVVLAEAGERDWGHVRMREKMAAALK